ncbi:hypothetical protein F511_20952 [Dorcoceras hygrometricum]|uniref:Uncharacterized protein n=1 Tax=Dorcoceras hygrometricum TaxID=472368 RepID=A0A2Z7C7L1_9LAMI|nr:hypothetical protein F511_20952 [Dorcoceras hygrometricum]
MQFVKVNDKAIKRYTAICLWKFGAESPTSPLVGPIIGLISVLVVGAAADPDPAPRGVAEDFKILHRERRLAPTNFTRKLALQRLTVVVLLIRSTTGITTPSSVCTRKRDESFTDVISLSRWSEQVQPRQATANGGGRRRVEEATAESGRGRRGAAMSRVWSVVFLDNVALGIQLAVGPQQLRLRNHNFGLTHRTMVKRLATSPHDPLGITDSACKNQWRSNSDIACVTRVSMTFRVVRTNLYNQDLGLIHSKNGNHLESPNEGSSIDHQVTIHLHAQNITMFPTNETWYFTSQMLVSSSGGLILILTAQSTRNEFRTHSDY